MKDLRAQQLLEATAVDKRIDYCIILSIIFHILLFFLFSRTAKAIRNYAHLTQITFIDQTYRPEVAKILPKIPPLQPGSTQGSQTGIKPETPTIVSSVPPTEEVSTIDFSQKLDRSQAVIDLNRYEIAEGPNLLDVVRIGDRASGTQKSTEEILLEKPVELAKGLSRGSDVSGLLGYPGVTTPEPPIQIEHKPLQKPQGQSFKFAPNKSSDADEKTLAKSELEPIRGTNILIAGPISQRQIINKVLPQYPAWALERGISGTVIIRIWVMPDGTVKETMTVEQSSGYPELDIIVINALRRWEFAPLAPNVIQEVQWGVITFKFCLN
jgi:TonB family protein